MDFSEQAIAGRLAGRYIGHRIRFFNKTESTNNIAFNLASHGAPEGTVVIADHQTRGKGRMNRVWQSPPRCNLYTSIILRPHTAPANTAQIPLMAGVAAAEVLSRYCPSHVALKWPNDVQIKGKKVCGILTEMKASEGPRVNFAIVGIGININMNIEDFDESFRELSTSLKEETGGVVSRSDVAVELYEHFEKWHRIWIRKGFTPIKEAWLSYSRMIGKQAQVVFQGDVKTGEVIGIDEYGALILQDEKGKLKRIMAGDATVIRN
jgi:BirA family biotin operon repressor/biotin-[acetyl-CoA-carboxylase] ligase